MRCALGISSDQSPDVRGAESRGIWRCTIRAGTKDDPDLWDQILRAARGGRDMNYMGLLQMFKFRITPDLTARFIGGHVDIVTSPDLANYGVSAA
jgi:hypothetical protein